MNDIFFYDTSFTLIHIASGYLSANCTLRFRASGSFEFHFAKDRDMVKCFLENLDIQNGKMIFFRFGEHYGIVTGFRISENLEVYGKTPDFLFEKKAVLPFSDAEGTSLFSIYSRLIGEAFPDAEISGSAEFPVLKTVFEKTSPTALSGIVTELTELYGLGYCLSFSPELKKLSFELKAPTETGNKFFCDDGFAYDIIFAYDVKDYSSHGIYKSGDLYEYAEKIPSDGLSRWERASVSEDEATAKTVLDACRELYDISLKFKALKYGEDYFLGDKFKLFTGYRCFYVMVKEISLSYEDGTQTENPKFEILKEE